MKCNSKKVRAEKSRIANERAAQEREFYLASLSEDERTEFLAKERERQKESLKAVSRLFGFAALVDNKGYWR